MTSEKVRTGIYGDFPTFPDSQTSCIPSELPDADSLPHDRLEVGVGPPVHSFTGLHFLPPRTLRGPLQPKPSRPSTAGPSLIHLFLILLPGN